MRVTLRSIKLKVSEMRLLGASSRNDEFISEQISSVRFSGNHREMII